MKFEPIREDQGYKTTRGVAQPLYAYSLVLRWWFHYIFAYIDDILIVGKSVSRISRLKKEMSKKNAMKDFGPTKCILVIKNVSDRKSNQLYLS
jgi:hypothetical protein